MKLPSKLEKHRDESLAKFQNPESLVYQVGYNQCYSDLMDMVRPVLEFYGDEKMVNIVYKYYGTRYEGGKKARDLLKELEE